MNNAPIVDAYEKHLREKIKQETVKELKERFVLEKWHVISAILLISMVCAVFRAQILALSAFLIAYLCFDTFLEKTEKQKVESSSEKSIEVVDIGVE